MTVQYNYGVLWSNNMRDDMNLWEDCFDEMITIWIYQIDEMHNFIAMYWHSLELFRDYKGKEVDVRG